MNVEICVLTAGSKAVEEMLQQVSAVPGWRVRCDHKCVVEFDVRDFPDPIGPVIKISYFVSLVGKRLPHEHA